MAEEKDPFEDALSALDADMGDDGKKDKDPFEDAMASLSDSDPADAATDDPFENALQVAKTEHKISAAESKQGDHGKSFDVNYLKDIKVTLTFEVGRAKMFISDLLSLGQGSVIELHRLVGEELELFVNGQLIAAGEVVVVNEKFGAKITKIIKPDERVKRLGPYH